MEQQSDNRRKSLHRKLKYLRIFGSSLGCLGGIGIIGFLANVTDNVLLIPSFGATCVIMATIPDSAFAQPRNVVAGHFLASFVGLLSILAFGNAWWSIAVAVGISAAVMQITRTLHPPAAANPIFFMINQSMPWQPLLTSVLIGSILLVFYFFIFHQRITKRTYPKYWL